MKSLISALCIAAGLFGANVAFAATPAAKSATPAVAATAADAATPATAMTTPAKKKVKKHAVKKSVKKIAAPA